MVEGSTDLFCSALSRRDSRTAGLSLVDVRPVFAADDFFDGLGFGGFAI